MLSKIKKVIPKRVIKFLKNESLKRKNKRLGKLKPLTKEKVIDLLSNDLGVKKGDVLFIHSSLGNLILEVSPFEILSILIELVGEEGTILFPTYPKLTSYKFLKESSTFNIKKTPSYMGILSELARRHPKAIRSLHPTKSVVAIGKYAKELTTGHQNSIYPYDSNSPYFKINKYNAKIIGFGVSTVNLSCVHCVDDFMKYDYPVFPYEDEIFEAKCIDYDNNSVIVKTYAHDMNKMGFNLPKFMKKYINKDICEDLEIEGMKFFKADANQLFEKMISLAENGITIYKKRFYK